MLEDGSVQIYSRNLENTTAKYPDIAARMAGALKPGVKSVVLDCEAQAWDAERRVFLPFQVLTTRKRKDVRAEDVKVQVWLPTALLRGSVCRCDSCEVHDLHAEQHARACGTQLHAHAAPHC